MATPHLNNIIDNFCDRIGDPSTYSGTVLQPGKILTSAAQIVSFVNRAMFEHIRRYWVAVKGDVKLFAEILPELVKPINPVLLDAASSYVIANPNLDFMKVFGALYKDNNNAYIRVAPKEEYLALKSGFNTRIGATESEPVLVEINKVLYLFPVTMAAKHIEVIYIKQPLNPTDGSFLVQNGSYDSPFYDTWDDEIAGIAEVIYRKSAQEID